MELRALSCRLSFLQALRMFPYHEPVLRFRQQQFIYEESLYMNVSIGYTLICARNQG
jgi:hypothetical protein